MGEMMESFRHATRRRRGRRLADLLSAAALRAVLPHRARVAALSDLLELYERTGLRRLDIVAFTPLRSGLLASEKAESQAADQEQSHNRSPLA